MTRSLTLRSDELTNTSATMMIGIVLITALIVYLIMRNKQSSLPVAKQWQIQYNPEGLMTGIQMIEIPKV